jgi:hypothetical protein
MKEHAKKGHTIEEGNLHSTFFTSVGTTVHEGVQDWIGKTGKVLGDWQCVNSECIKSLCKEPTCKTKECSDHSHTIKAMQVGNLCKACNKPMKYHELEVKWNIITGHVDVIIKIGKQKYWAGDYKTVAVDKLAELKAPPINYIYQISSYAWILKNEYDIPIVGFSIFYITRDNPGVFKEFSYEFDAEAEAKAKKLIDGEIKKHNAATKSFETGNINFAINAKPCRNAAQYEKLMGKYCKCPFVDVCFNSNPTKLTKAITIKIAELTQTKTSLSYVA